MPDRFREKGYRLADKILEHSLWGMMFFIPFSKAGIEIFFGIGFLSFTAKKVFKPDFSFLRKPASVAVLFFAVFSGLSILVSGPYAQKSIETFFFKWLEYIMIYFFAVDTLSKSSRQRIMIYILLAFSLIVGIDGIFQKVSGFDFIRGKEIMRIREGMGPVTGPFNHFNDFGAYLVVTLSMCMALIAAVRIPRAVRWGVAVSIVPLAGSLLLTFSRGAWLGLTCAVILMFLLSRRGIVGVVLLLLSGIAGSLPFVRDRLMYTFYVHGDGGRSVLWDGTMRMIIENPWFGKGLGTFMDYFPQYVPNVEIQYAHNCYLQIWAESGLLALVSFLAFLGILLWKGISSYRASKDSLLLGLICGVFGFAVHSFFDTQLYSLQLSALFWLLLGMLYSASRSQDPLDKKAFRPARHTT